MNGHRKAITKNKNTSLIIQSTKEEVDNSKKNVSEKSSSRITLEKEEQKIISTLLAEKKGRENQLTKSAISHTHHNIIESIISKYKLDPPNSLLVYQMSYLWRKLKPLHHTISNFFTKRTKKRKKPGGIISNNRTLREALIFMLCYAGQTVSAWNDHYDEEDGKYYKNYIKIINEQNYTFSKIHILTQSYI